MIIGQVDNDNNSLISLEVETQTWTAVVDTGFTGDLELPEELRLTLRAIPHGQVLSLLAAGQHALEDLFEVQFAFDGEIYRSLATLTNTSAILIGTNMLRKHRLEIDYVARTVRIIRGPTSN